MEILKLIIMIEIMGMFVCGAMHLICFLIGEEFQTEIYLIVAAIALVATLLAAYVFVPIYEWIECLF